MPVARILGVEIRISAAWAVLVAIVTLIGAEQAALTAPELPAPVQWGIGAVIALGFLASVIAHELAHALTGRRLGVEPHPIVLGFIGGLAPLSIEAQSPQDELLIAVAGPILSILVALASLILAMFAWAAGATLGPIAGGLLVIGGLNLLLGLLSLLPGMPLDGGRAVRALAWARTRDRDRASRITARVGRMLGWTTFGIGAVLAVLDRFTEGLLIICLGWLLATGARTLDRRVALETLLRGARVGDGLRRDVPQVAPNLTVDTFADRYQGEDALPALPVVDDDRVVGVVARKRLQRLGRRKFAATRAADVMSTPPLAPILAPDDPLWDAVDLMNQQGFDGLAVAVDGRLEGMLTKDSIGEVVRRMVAARQGTSVPTPTRTGDPR